MATRLTALAQLIEDGTSPVQTELYHPARLHPEREVRVRVVSGGIEVKGKIYPSPLGAARAVTGAAAENGGIWWRVKGTGEPLSGLRQKA